MAKLICDHSKDCINDDCDHIRLHDYMHSCSDGICEYAYNNIAGCYINLKEERKEKLKKLNESR